MFGIGLLIAVCGIGLVILAGGLWPNSRAVREREQLLLSKQPNELTERERGERGYYVLNSMLRRLGWCTFYGGVLFAFAALLFN